jgi:hypothetical protein
LKEVQTKLAIEQQLYVDMNNQRIEMEETLTEELAEQIEERKSEQDDYVEHFRKKANEQVDIARITAEQMQAYALAYQEALASMNMSGGSSSPMTTNNTLNQTNIINNPSDQSFVQAMTNRISPV